MAVTIQQIIEKIKTNSFTPKDYSKDVLITIDGIVNLFRDENKNEHLKNDILTSLSGSKKIKIDMLTGRIEISKDIFQ